MNENIEVTSNYFAMVTHGQIFAGKSETDLYNALYNRKFPYCEVAVLKSLHEADFFAKNRYHALFYANPHLYPMYPMPMPLAQEYNLDIGTIQTLDANQGSNLNNRNEMRFCVPVVQINVNADLFWAIDAINGYGVANDLNILLHMLTNCGLDYAHAVTYRNEYDAAIHARDCYVNRFIHRYGYTEIPHLFDKIIQAGNILVDPDYPNKEERLKSRSLVTALHSFGLL